MDRYNPNASYVPVKGWYDRNHGMSEEGVWYGASIEPGSDRPYRVILKNEDATKAYEKAKDEHPLEDTEVATDPSDISSETVTTGSIASNIGFAQYGKSNKKKRRKLKGFINKKEEKETIKEEAPLQDVADEKAKAFADSEDVSYDEALSKLSDEYGIKTAKIAINKVKNRFPEADQKFKSEDSILDAINKFVDRGTILEYQSSKVAVASVNNNGIYYIKDMQLIFETFQLICNNGGIRITDKNDKIVNLAYLTEDEIEADLELINLGKNKIIRNLIEMHDRYSSGNRITISDGKLKGKSGLILENRNNKLIIKTKEGIYAIRKNAI